VYWNDVDDAFVFWYSLFQTGEQMAEEAEAQSRILLVEDDAKLSRLIQEYLQENGFVVEIEPTGDRAPDRIQSEKPDLVILDIMLPGMDGLTICKTIRPDYPGPILMLTARGEEIDEVIGLEYGADDYLAKPVSPRLLLARIAALLRRAHPGSSRADEEEVFRVELGPLVVDARNRVVTLDQTPVELTSAEFELLWYLARHAGQVIERERIYRDLRGIEYDGLDRSIDLRIARLRKKLGDDGKNPKMIMSVRGVGYLMAADP
jgi:two-component system response regulator RstA